MFSRRAGARFNRGRIAIAGGGGEWSPASIAGLLSDHDARKGITFNSTLFDASVTGDAITLTGTLGPYATTPHDIRVDITTAGAPGTGKFRVSLNSGHDYVIVAGSYDITIPVGLTYAIPGTAITLNFANVAFNLNAIYVAGIESWADQSGNGHTFTRQAANSAPLLIRHGRTNNGFGRLARGIVGRWALTADAAHVLENAGTWATDLAGGTNNTFHLFVVVSCDLQAAAAQTFVGVGRAASAVPFLYLGTDTAANDDTFHTWRNDANVTGNANGTNDADARAHVFELEYDGANSYTRLNGTQIGTSAVARGAMTVDRGAFFALIRNTVSNRAIASLARVVAYSTNLSAGNASTARTQLATIHDVAPPKNIRVSIDGDSFAATGNGNGAFPNVMVFGNDLTTIVNQATSGSTISGMEARAAAVDANYSAGANGNILIIHCGTNDIGLDGTGDLAAIKAAMISYVADRKAVGWYVILNTIKARVDSGGVSEAANFATKRADYNTWVRAGTSGANAYYDESLDWPGTLLDLIWDQDGTHPTTPGASRIADLAEAQYRIYTASL